MKSYVAGWILLGGSIGPLAAHAASETLTYTSADLSNTYSTGTFAGEVSGTNSYFTASLTLNAPLTANMNDVNVSSEVASLVFTTIDPNAPTADQKYVLDLTPAQAQVSAFYLSTNSSGVVTAWNFTAGITEPSLSSTSDVLYHSCYGENCAAGSYNGQNYAATGDWYDYEPGSATASDGCTYNPVAGCGTGGGTGAVGKWSVAAPEMSPASAISGLLLVIGGVAVLRGHRPRAA